MQIQLRIDIVAATARLRPICEYFRSTGGARSFPRLMSDRTNVAVHLRLGSLRRRIFAVQTPWFSDVLTV